MRRSYQTYKHNKIYDNFQAVKPQYEKAKKILDECRQKHYRKQFAPPSEEEMRIIEKNRKFWREFNKSLSDIEKNIKENEKSKNIKENQKSKNIKENQISKNIKKNEK